MKKSPEKKKSVTGNKTAAKKKSPALTKETTSGNDALPVFHPDILKNDLVRQTIITILWKRDEATVMAILEDLKREIGHHFDGDIELYFNKVKADLENRKLLEVSPGKRPPHYRLAQKLEKTDEDE